MPQKIRSDPIRSACPRRQPVLASILQAHACYSVNHSARYKIPLIPSSHGRKPAAAASSSIHRFHLALQAPAPTRPAAKAASKPENESASSRPHIIHGRAGREAGARAAAVQPEHRRACRGGLRPVPRAVRRRAGGAGDHVPEGARHDVPQGRVGGGRVHGRGRPARGPRGGRRPRRHRAGPRPLALQEPPLRGPDLRGVHVPAPRRRRAPPVARDGVPQAHLGNGAAGDGRVPALVDARGAGAARRAARRAAVCSLNDWSGDKEAAAAPARKDRQRVRTSRFSLSRCSGRPAGPAFAGSDLVALTGESTSHRAACALAVLS